MIYTEQKQTHYQVGALHLPSGDYTDSDEETAKYVLQVNFTGSSVCPDLLGLLGLDNPKAALTMTMTFLPFKSAGKDNILPPLIQKG